MSPARVITDLGDLFPAAAVAAVIFAWCWAQLDRLTAMTFAVCFAGTAVVDTLLKLMAAQAFVEPSDSGLFQLSTGAPSGHAALATLVYGTASLLFATAGRGLSAVVGAVAALAALVLVLVTRVTLRTHTVADVVAGVAVAAGFVLLFDLVRRRRAHPRTDGAPALLIGMALVAVFALGSGVRISSDMFL